MKSFISIAALVLLASMPGVIAHIDMQDPAPIRHKSNKFATSVDNDYTAPVKEICKGYHKLGGADLTPVAKWAAGSQQKFVLGGSAVHGGGSCQASISEDGGNTWKAIKTYIGDCPHAQGAAGTFDFTVPKETKNGKVLFAWSWFNKVGNREMYMNCASIEITGGGSGLSSFPDMFVANIGNGCTTADGKDVDIPNPGKDVVKAPNAATAPPTGTCGSTGPTQPQGEKKPDTGAPPPPQTSPTQKPPVANPQVEVVKPGTGAPTPTQKPPVSDPKNAPDTEAPEGVETPDTKAPAPSQISPPTEKPPIVDSQKEVKKPVDAPQPPTTQPPANGSCTTGAIVCTSATTWSLCSNGTLMPMGTVASGTKCVNGAIAKRAPIRFSKDHMSRKF